MNFKESTQQVSLIKRYKRFFADVKTDDGQTLTAHVPNTGSLKTCLSDNAPCIITLSNDPKRKLKATLQFIKTPTGWAGVNTSLPNMIVNEALNQKIIKDWTPYPIIKPEFKLSPETRIDFALAKTADDLGAKKNLYFIEVKNVTYAEHNVAYFPDAVTTRGQKHLKELMDLVRQGHQAEILFVVQRQNIKRFKPQTDIDPEYAKLLKKAKSKGVVVRALACNIDPLKGVTLTSDALDIEL